LGHFDHQLVTFAHPTNAQSAAHLFSVGLRINKQRMGFGTPADHENRAEMFGAQVAPTS
jgi:hypothetical protein